MSDLTSKKRKNGSILYVKTAPSGVKHIGGFNEFCDYLCDCYDKGRTMLEAMQDIEIVHVNEEINVAVN